MLKKFVILGSLSVMLTASLPAHASLDREEGMVLRSGTVYKSPSKEVYADADEAPVKTWGETFAEYRPSRSTLIKGALVGTALVATGYALYSTVFAPAIREDDSTRISSIPGSPLAPTSRYNLVETVSGQITDLCFECFNTSIERADGGLSVRSSMNPRCN